MHPLFYIFISLTVICVLAPFISLAHFFSIWIRARVAGAPIGLFQLIFMRLRGVPPALVVDARIAAFKAGFQVTSDELEAHYLSGGNIVRTVQGLIAAGSAGIPLDWKNVRAIDLSTRGSNKSILDIFNTTN